MTREETFYFDKFGGGMELHRQDRTVANRMAEDKGQAVGTFVAMLVNELDHLGPNDTLEVTVRRED